MENRGITDKRLQIVRYILFLRVFRDIDTLDTSVIQSCKILFQNICNWNAILNTCQILLNVFEYNLFLGKKLFHDCALSNLGTSWSDHDGIFDNVTLCKFTIKNKISQ